MRGRPLLVLVPLMVVAALAIGFSLTRQRALTADEATVECERQNPHGSIQARAACIRSKIYPRAAPTTTLIVLFPLGFGAVTVALLLFTARRNRPRLCPTCGDVLASDDAACPACPEPVAT